MSDFKNLLKNQFLLSAPQWSSIEEKDLAEIYVDIAFLLPALHFLKEQQWLHKNEAPDLIEEALFSKELVSLDYLREFIQSENSKGFQRCEKNIFRMQSTLVAEVLTREALKQKKFLTLALRKMSKLYEFEAFLQNEKRNLGQHLGFSLYRTFDSLDEILGLDYLADRGMFQDQAITERLYEGAGIGVQSGYSTVLTALSHLNLKTSDRFVDLGSGYGRVGLILGLLHPEIEFKGYEYVPHRVQIANDSSHRLTLSEHVKFYTQDLSLQSFEIPEAEVYYLYDPFSEKTYGHVLEQLVSFSRNKKITIVTKGNARGWLVEIANSQGWKPPQEFDGSNLCLFQSN